MTIQPHSFIFRGKVEILNFFISCAEFASIVTAKNKGLFGNGLVIGVASTCMLDSFCPLVATINHCPALFVNLYNSYCGSRNRP